MSDLRTRIAVLLPSIFDRIADGEFVEWGDMADAVIRELGLTREDPNQAWFDAGGTIPHRYVTEWTTDEV